MMREPWTGTYRPLGRRYSAVVKFLPFVAGVDFHPFGIPLPFYKRLPHFFKGLFGIGDDAFAFACRIIFNPIVYFLAPLIFSHDRDLSILVEQIVIAIPFAVFDGNNFL